MSELTRRGFIEWAVGVGSGVMALFYLGTAFELVKPVPPKAVKLQSIGALTKYPLGEPTFTSYTGEGILDGLFVVRHPQGTPTVFDFHCAHLQCPVQWIPAAHMFACPCHGSTYNAQGEHTGGPAPHGLFYHYNVIRNGDIYVGGIDGHMGNAPGA